jgi:predicted nucleic acid-binding protein
MIVLDASVILKWLLPEEDRAVALGFLDKHISGQEQIAIPELLYYEAGNILAVKSKLTPEALTEGMHYLFELELLAFTLGRKEHLEAVRLARSLSVPFITADEKLVRKLKNLPFVQILKNYQ